jgi:hypothetical protein
VILEAMSMMFEDRQLIGLEDIAGIQYECLRCHAKQILPIAALQRAPKKCANCNEEWFSGPMERGEERLSRALTELKGIADIMKSISSLKIMLELVSQEPAEDKD